MLFSSFAVEALIDHTRPHYQTVGPSEGDTLSSLYDVYQPHAQVDAGHTHLVRN